MFRLAVALTLAFTLGAGMIAGARQGQPRATLTRDEVEQTPHKTRKTDEFNHFVSR